MNRSTKNCDQAANLAAAANITDCDGAPEKILQEIRTPVLASAQRVTLKSNPITSFFVYLQSGFYRLRIEPDLNPRLSGSIANGHCGWKTQAYLQQCLVKIALNAKTVWYWDE